MRTKEDYQAQSKALPPKGKTGNGRTISEPVAVMIPDRTISDELAHGIYANSVDSLNTGTEIVLDFTLVYPRQWKKNATSEDLQQSLKNEVVSRIMMPSDRWDEFVVSYALSNPQMLEFLKEQLEFTERDEQVMSGKEGV